MAKIQLFGIPELHDAIVEAVKKFQDPLKPGDPIYKNNVVKALPGKEKLSLYSGVLGHVDLGDVPTVHVEAGVEVAQFPGGLYTWIAGRDSNAISRCQHYCDIAKGYFRNGGILELPGSYITGPKDYPFRFSKVSISGPANKPVYYVVGYTGFIVEKELDDQVYTL